MKKKKKKKNVIYALNASITYLKLMTFQTEKN